MATDRHMDSDTAISPEGRLRRIEVITGAGRRRRWTAEQKLRIVAESFEGSCSVSEIARRHDISPSLLFLWRRQAREPCEAMQEPGTFVPIVIGNGDSGERKAPPAATVFSIEIEVAHARIRLAGPVDETALAAVLAALGKRP